MMVGTMQEVVIAVPSDLVEDYHHDLATFLEQAVSANASVEVRAPAPRPVPNLRDASLPAQLVTHIPGALDILVPLVAFWIGRGKSFELRIGKSTIIAKGYSANDLARVIAAVKSASAERDSDLTSSS